MSKSRVLAAVISLGFIFMTGASMFALVRYVDLKPQIDMNFFFSSDDPQFAADKKITEMFPQPPQIVMSAYGNIFSKEYAANVRLLTADLRAIPEVYKIHSLAHGPAGIEDALKSPLWKRILIEEHQRATYIHIFISDVPTEQIVPKIENLIRKYSAPGFELRVSGVPYVIEMIRRNLLQDLKIFTAAAFIIFGLILLFTFRSARILFGTLLTCINASIFTLLAAQAFRIKIGLLTANLSTIVFVLTLSHIIFITFNWQHLSEQKNEGEGRVRAALLVTWPGSFWSMITTMLGFVSLLFVQAKPLRQLGVSGAIGTFIAFLSAYAIYPWFLGSRAKTKLKRKKGKSEHAVFWDHPHAAYVMGILCFALFAAPGILKLNTDPSLLDYFKKGSKLRQDLEYIDQASGSSPLKIVVSDPNKIKFNSTKALDRLWQLQLDLEREPQTGSVVSLPLIMAEAKRSPIAFFMRWEWLLKLMETPRFDEVAHFFITKDRTQVFFLMNMREGGPAFNRLVTIGKIKRLIEKRGFRAELIGGIYLLQAEISELLRSSLVSGLALLIGLFLVIGLILSFSIRTTFSLFISLCLIPAALLGVLGYARIPVDVISSPAANISIGLGVDAMMHFLIWLRRFQRQGLSGWDAWTATRQQLWKPILFAAVIICAGFGIFGLSDFPPTQRFGFAVIIGSVMSPLAALFILPFFGSSRKAMRQGVASPAKSRN